MVGLAEGDLVNPHYRIESSKLESMWEYIVAQTDNKNLGLFLGLRSSFAVLGILGNLIQNSPNLETAAKKACEFSLLYTDSVKMELMEKTFHDVDHPIGFREGAYLKGGYYKLF